MSTTGADSRECRITAVSPSTFTGSPLTMTVPDGQTSVTSGPIFSSGTQVSADGYLTVTSTNIAWDADAQTVTMDSDKTTTLTLTETGPRKYRMTCSIMIDGIDLTSGDTSGNTAKCFVIRIIQFASFDLDIPAGSSSVTSEDEFVNGPYRIVISATIQGTEYVAEDGGIVITISGSDFVIPTFNLVPKTG